MKQKAFTIIDATQIVVALSRAGQRAGITNVARLAGVTNPRASRVLHEALKCGLLYAYRNNYRSHVVRSCYAVTETGKLVIKAILDHDDSVFWEFHNDKPE